tara:strand:+ start:1191 stop:1994 length:804 start_codon:yes stop_codon:yes gene_type:complete
MPILLLAMLVVPASFSIAGEKPKASVKDHPLPEKTRKMMTDAWKQQVAELTKQIEQQPKRVGFYSRRADAHFFLGNFDKAVADYEKMVELDKSLDTSHWRRGIAWFYAKNFKQAAHQFEIYDSFDNVDRENGIWRFFSQARAYGIKKARQGLLKYKKDDREPFPSVYKLFSETIKPEKILADIKAAKISDSEREKRYFYAQLYIGLDHAIHDRNKKAVVHLREAVGNTWGPRAGFGPHYMWQVGRLHYELLTAKATKDAKSSKSPKP